MRARRLGLDELKEYAVRVLSGRAYSTGELRQKLAARAENPGDVDDLIARLKEYGYLNDKQFAETYASVRLETQGFGRTRVVRDLRRRRVAPTLAEQATSKIYQGTDEVALVEEYIRRKYRGKARDGFLQEPKDLASAYRRLLNAGFTSANSIRALKRFAKEPELLDQFEPPPEEPEQG